MREGVVAAPGAFNGLVARAVARAGFDAAYVSGAAVSASAGVPDIGLVTLDGFCSIIRQVSAASGLPVLADADTGFGEVEMVARTVHAYTDAGAAGLHIEDQVFPKRCGHLEGKRLIAIDHFQEKVAAGARARDAIAARTGDRPVICARTDARGVEGMPAAIERATAYVEAGADMIFPEGLTSEAEFAEFSAAMAGLAGESRRGGPYLLANMTEFGKTPTIPLARFGELGYDLVIFPVTTLRIAMRAVEDALLELARDGSAEGLLPRMQTRAELYDLLGYTPGEAWTYPGPTRPQ
ncbi:MAG: methylisocitrate lyase [Planctomycetota bacterium]|nr:MAG: methylisocitrate lyase [Planctomycetota bacterium]